MIIVNDSLSMIKDNDEISSSALLDIQMFLSYRVAKTHKIP